MEIRKCIFTGEESNAKVEVTENKNNWTNSVPTTNKYKEKMGVCLTDLEAEAVDVFFLIELAKNKQLIYEKQLENIQKNIKKPVKDQKPVKRLSIEEMRKRDALKKEVQIEKCIKEKAIMEESEKAIEQVLKNRMRLWE